MSYIYSSFCLLILYFIFAFLVLCVVSDLSRYADITETCTLAGQSLGTCRWGAMAVAAYSVATLTMALLVGTALFHASTSRAVPRFPLDNVAARSLLLMFLVVVSIVLVAHNLERSSVPSPPNVRIPPRQSALISLENLCWPVLLQLAFWTRDKALRAIIVSFLAIIVALSPFRAVLFAIAYFGVITPLAAWLLTTPAQKRRTVWLAGSALALVAITLALAIGYQTETRVERSRLDIGETPQRGELLTAFVSRGLNPLFQAKLVAQVVATDSVAVPSFVQTVTAKLRLSSGPSLNQYLYAMLYNTKEEGQTTSLLFGEAAANSTAWPVYWMFAAPLFLILLYGFTRNYADMGILVAVALWRGAMGGLFDVLPALVLQLAFCAVLALSSRAKLRR
jgi:hypothetical protein